MCRTLEHLCKLYKASLKGKEKEVNFTKHDDPMDDSTHLDTSDFTDDFADLSIHRDLWILVIIRYMIVFPYFVICNCQIYI